jgi:hypothetical protein
MFVGHYGPAFVARKLKGSIPLWVLFAAAQLLDIVWCILVLLGINKVNLEGGYEQMDPYYMPFDHGLDAALLWSLGAGFAYWLWRKSDGRLAALLVGATVFSHWMLDFITHKPELALVGDSFKVGLGLWKYPVMSLVAEIAALFGGMYVYMRATKAVTPGGRYAMFILGLVMLAIHISLFFGPPPPSTPFAAIAGLVCYVGFTACAFWLDKKRVNVVLGRVNDVSSARATPAL